MKFARLLRTTAEDLPELQCLFHIYKHMKKQLKKLPARSDCKALSASEPGPAGELPAQHPANGSDAGAGRTEEAAEEARFTAVLTDHLQKLNDRFLEREETCVIQLERLEAEAAACAEAAARIAAGTDAAGDEAAPVDGAATAGANPTGAGAGAGATSASTAATMKAISEQRSQLYKRLVNFHGEVLLLVHWSVLAYTATVKILKKHHKRTGLLLRAPQLADLLSQPFCSSELMTSLARKAEACIQRLTEQLGGSGTSEGTEQGANGAAGPKAAAAGAVAGGGQESVDQGTPGRAAVAAAAAGQGPNGMSPVGDHGGDMEADGSSPSCSQSLGHPGRKREAPGPDGGGGEAGPGPETAAAAAAGCGGAARARGEGGKGDFLRNLARLSENNSAASLSGPQVLERLVELQHIVDVYDKYDEDADGDEEITDEDDESAGQPAAGTGAGAAGMEAGGSAAVPGCQASVHGRVGRGSTSRGLDRRPSGAGPTEDGLDREGTPSSSSSGEDGKGENVEAAAVKPTPRPAASQQQQEPVPCGGAHGVAAGGEAAGTHAVLQAAEHQQQAAAQQHIAAQEEAAAAAAADAAPTAVTPMQVERSSDLACDPHGVSVEGGGGDGSAVHQPMVAERDLPPVSSSGSAGNGHGQGLGAAGPAGSCSNMGAAGAPTGSLADSVAQRLMGVGHKAGSMQGATDLVRRTQAALTMWEHLRTNVSTPSTVLDPAAPMTMAMGGPPAKRQRVQESVGDDSDSNSD